MKNSAAITRKKKPGAPRSRAPRGVSLPAGWKLEKARGAQVLVAAPLARERRLVHGFSTRQGGKSRLDDAPALNLGYTDWDTRPAVDANRRAFQAALGAGDATLVTLRQIHSDTIYRLDAKPSEAPRGDAMITRTPGLLLAVQTADCVPVLLADRRRMAIAAIHAGWRGTLARIVAKTVGRMRMEFGSNPADIIAAIGPAIGQCSFEVGPEVAQAFAGQFPEARGWFEGPFDLLASGEEPNPFKWLSMVPPGHDPPPPRVQLDLIAANRWQLADAGVPENQITAVNLCT
ncbi:MAG: peptidoglycan editing factor PgeF, partial [Bryobacteraceae bacterium]